MVILSCPCGEATDLVVRVQDKNFRWMSNGWYEDADDVKDTVGFDTVLPDYASTMYKLQFGSPIAQFPRQFVPYLRDILSKPQDLPIQIQVGDIFFKWDYTKWVIDDESVRRYPVGDVYGNGKYVLRPADFIMDDPAGFLATTAAQFS